MSEMNSSFNASIEISGKEVIYTLEGNVTRFLIKEIQLIGEFTAEPARFATDHFFTFKVKGMETELDVPVFTKGIYVVLETLRHRMKGMVAPQLETNFSYYSKILYPAKYQDRKLYLFETKIKPLINIPLLKGLVMVETVEKLLNPELIF